MYKLYLLKVNIYLYYKFYIFYINILNNHIQILKNYLYHLFKEKSFLNIINYVTYIDGITVYELYAVICHLGPSSMSGHFVAYCRNRIDNQWYLYNDAIVTKCTRKFQYNDGMPYILFYRAIPID